MEYRFKAWDTETQQVVDVARIDFYAERVLVRYETPHGKLRGGWRNMGQVFLKRGLGYKDRTGTDIYIGDIIRADSEIGGKTYQGVVCENWDGPILRWLDGEGWDGIPLFSLAWKFTLHVVGEVHKDPEMAEKL